MTRFTVGVAVSTLLFAGASCGTDDGAQKGADRKGAEVTETLAPVPGGALAALRSAASRAAGKDSARVTITLDLGDVSERTTAGTAKVSGTGAFDATGSSTTITIGSSALETVTTGDWTYERFPGSEGWVKVPGADASAQSGALDPRMLLESLGSSGATVLEDGNEEIDGTTYDRLKATVDLGSLVRNGIPDGADQPTSERLSQMASMMQHLEMTVWVDSSNALIRRMTLDMGQPLGNRKETIDFSDWGDPGIRIDVPTDAREVTLDQLAALADPTGGN
jgi:hypothetical protein